MMSEREYNEIFAENLKRYLDLNDMSQTDLARRLGVSAQSVTNWCAGKKSPRMDKVDAMCKIFGCNRSDLMEVQTSGHQKVYYENAETAQLAQEMFEDRDMRALFNMKRNMDPDRFAIQMRAFRDMYRLEHPEEFPEDFND